MYRWRGCIEFDKLCSFTGRYSHLLSIFWRRQVSLHFSNTISSLYRIGREKTPRFQQIQTYFFVGESFQRSRNINDDFLWSHRIYSYIDFELANTYGWLYSESVPSNRKFIFNYSGWWSISWGMLCTVSAIIDGTTSIAPDLTLSWVVTFRFVLDRMRSPLN